jgi:hypothetical protein
VSDWFGRILKMPKKPTNPFMAVASHGWDDAVCNACQAGNCYSFNWAYSRSPEGRKHWPKPPSDALRFDRKLRAGTLYRCSQCQSPWYLDPHALMMNYVQTERIPLILNWSNNTLQLSSRHLQILSQIGETPHDIYGNGAGFNAYPCSVHTHSGEFFPTAIISRQSHAPFEMHRTYRLGSEISTIEPSRFALPLEVRVATSRADEIRMGFAPTILETPEGKRLTANWTINFIAMDGVDAKTIRVAQKQGYFDDTPSVIEEPNAVYFVADQ